MTPTPPRRNNEAPPSLKLNEIAALVGGEVVGDGGLAITGVAGIKEAGPGDITFLANARYLPYLSRTAASAVVTARDVQSDGKSLVRTDDPSAAFTKIISVFHPPAPEERRFGIHPTAVIGEDVTFGLDVSLGPHVVIESGCRIGDRTQIDAGAFIGKDCRIGSDTTIYPNVTVRERVKIGDRVIIHSGAVIGSDGFGYEIGGEQPVKIPQTGTVQIDDDVEIGANVCVDRGRFDKTWIQRGVKIDNLVQIAHNVIVGSGSIIVSQAGISGSTELGKNVTIAGQAGIVGHVRLGDRVIVGAGSGVTKSVPDDTIVLGGPARPIQEQKKIFALIARLPELFKDLARIKKKLEDR